MAPSPSQHTGTLAEDAALAFLTRSGLTLLERNFGTRFGELDLIMSSNADEIVFVEVRLRQSERYGGGVQSVTRAKQRRLIRAAEIFLHRRRIPVQTLCRFDVVSVSKRNYAWTFDWVRDAFELG